MMKRFAALGLAICFLLMSGLCYAEEQPVIDVSGGQGVISDEPIAPLTALPRRPDPALSELTALPTAELAGIPAEGTFLTSGEYCYRNPAGGIYVYVSPTLHVRVTRYASEEPRLVWHEAEIWTQGGELVRTFGYGDGARDQDTTADPRKIALEKNLIIGVTTDFVHTRRKWATNAGIMIREGKVLNDVTYSAGHIKYPNNDNLALLSDGEMRVYPNATYSADEFLAMGAYDVFSFGPILVSNYQPNTAVIRKLTGEGAQRVGVGVFSKDHYLLVMCEGRHARSRGATLTQFADIFVSRGVREAFNMDGGRSSAIVFMGEYIFYYTDSQSPRRGTELLGAGVSTMVGR